jgi:xanthine dehydrogenase small subunit
MQLNNSRIIYLCRLYLTLFVMITFILNDEIVHTDEPAGSVLLDFIRYKAHLPGTKAGCREGDCGACTVLQGSLENGAVKYKSIVSCLTPLGNVQGTHIVTIEGLQKEKMSPVQQAIMDNAATQCGFCTPGFVMSLTAHSLAPEKSTPEKVISAISGNICRCTGYRSIQQAAADISRVLAGKDSEDPLEWLIRKAFVPEYFRNIAARLKEIQTQSETEPAGKPIGGGTDLFVQQADALRKASGLRFVHFENALRKIEIKEGYCRLGGAVTASDIMQNETLQRHFPKLETHFKLISSEPVRNMGTVAGNIVNASPIADMVIFLLALDALLEIRAADGTQRTLPLREFYTGYKQMNLTPGETITAVRFRLPGKGLFNFEKVSKRKHLDIASVNSAMLIETENDRITSVHLSAGGVYAWPFYAAKTVDFLTGKPLTAETVSEASRVLLSEIAPISDIRGSSTYKSLLLRQLFFAHFMRIFPRRFTEQTLQSKILAL